MKMVWVDIETTGLDFDNDVILEVGIIIAESDKLKPVEGLAIPIQQPESTLLDMNEWCLKHHTESGLVDEVRQYGVEQAEAEARLLGFMQEFVPPRVAPMCGSSVHFDRRFLSKHMLNLESYFHYRNIDVSTVKELAKTWGHTYMDKPEPKARHRVLDDIRDSLDELLFYKENVFRER